MNLFNNNIRSLAPLLGETSLRNFLMFSASDNPLWEHTGNNILLGVITASFGIDERVEVWSEPVEPKTGTLTVNYVDATTKSSIRESKIVNFTTSHTENAANLVNYTPAGLRVITVTANINGQLLTHTFEYNKIAPPPIEQPDNDRPSSGGSGGSKKESPKQVAPPAPSSPPAPPSPAELEKTTPVFKENNLVDKDNFAPWYKNEVEEMYGFGLISGYTDGSFRGNDLIKREEFIKLIAASLGLEQIQGSSMFTDADGNWSQGYINAMIEAGYINGLTEDSFGIGQYITREQALLIISRVLGDKIGRAHV